MARPSLEEETVDRMTTYLNTRHDVPVEELPINTRLQLLLDEVEERHPDHVSSGGQSSGVDDVLDGFDVGGTPIRTEPERPSDRTRR